MRITLVAQNAQYMHTNLALRYIESALTAHDVSLYEGHINQPFDAVLYDIARLKPDILGLSCYIFNIDRMMKLARSLKRALPNLRIVLGGPEVELGADYYRAQLPEIDDVLVGEGVSAWLNYLGDNAEPRGIPDVYTLAVDPNRIWYIETARGCNNGCAYCLSPAQNIVDELPAQAALSRLLALSRHGAKLIKLVDRTFNANLTRAHEIWRGLIAEKPHATYHFEISGEHLTEESFDIFVSAPRGLFQLEIGVQTTNPDVLKRIGRKQDTDTLLKNIARLSALNNMHIHADLIAGLPGEDYASFARSFDAVYAARPHALQLGFLKLLRGSKLRKNADNEGIIYAPDAPYTVLYTREMSVDQLSKLRDIETALNWYANAGLFPASLHLARMNFARFELLAAHLRKSGAYNANRALKYKVNALRDWLLTYDDMHRVDASLVADMTSSNHDQELPDCISRATGRGT